MAARTGRNGAGHRETPEPRSAAVGAQIRRLRLEAGFNFDAVVEETGLGRGYISELERGLVVPTLTTLDRVAGVLELCVADLVIGDAPRERLFELTRRLPAADTRRVLRAAEATARRLTVAAPEAATAAPAHVVPAPAVARAAEPSPPPRRRRPRPAC